MALRPTLLATWPRLQPWTPASSFSPRWAGVAIAVLIAAAAIVGLRTLQNLEEDAHAADQVLTRLEIQTARLHSWDSRAGLGQSGPDELPTTQARVEWMIQAADELSRLQPPDPAITRLVTTLFEYQTALDEEMRQVALGDREGTSIAQHQQATPRYEAVTAALVPAQAAAQTRAVQASSLLAAGSIATLLVALATTALLAWAVERARRTTEQRGEARFRALVQNAAELVAILDSDGMFRYASPSAEALLGRMPEELSGHQLLAHVHPDDEPIVRDAIELACARPQTSLTTAFRVRCRGDAWRHMEATWRNNLEEPSIGGIVLNARDVSERKALEDQLAYRAYHDPLTDLPNRALLVDRLEHALARGARGPGRSALLFIDLDNFKAINDTLGHGLGDQLLVAVAGRLRASVRPGDTVARLGGDEFIVLIEDVVEGGDAVAVAERCLDELAAPVYLDDHPVIVGASIGIALSGPESSRAGDLLRRADVAMYEAKAGGKGRHSVFDAAMDARPRGRAARLVASG